MAGFFAVGALMLAPTLLVTDLRWLTAGPGLLMVLWLGVVATGLSYVLFQHGLLRVILLPEYLVPVPAADTRKALVEYGLP